MKPNPSADRQAYIPPSIEKAMSANLPAHLKQYVGNDRPSYVPPQIQKQINQQLQTMPTHLKQYAGAYMQQRVIQPNFSKPSTIQPNRVATGLPSRPPISNPLKLDHSMPFGEQQTVKINIMDPNQTSNTMPEQAGGPSPDYSFFLNPETPPKRSPLNILKGGSFKNRLLVLAGGALVLIIVIIVFASLLLGNNVNSASLLSLAQQQNELIRVAGEASTQAVNQTTKNLAINTQLALTTDQQQIVSYLASHHDKVSTKQLDMTKNSSTDTQLANAQAASNFDAVYVQITQGALTSYRQTLSTTYKAATDSAERQILNTEYVNAGLLLSEANSAASESQSD